MTQMLLELLTLLDQVSLSKNLPLSFLKVIAAGFQDQMLWGIFFLTSVPQAGIPNTF